MGQCFATAAAEKALMQAIPAGLMLHPLDEEAAEEDCLDAQRVVVLVEQRVSLLA